MNRRRILAGFLGVTVFGLGTLLLRSLHKSSTEAASSVAEASSGGAPVAPSEATLIPSVATTTQAAFRPPALETVAGITDIDPHKAFGSKNAPVVVEIFSDFQCPACKSLYLTTNRQLMDNYVSTGKVFLIHRDFPLPLHAYSKVAASYARAAAQLGKGEPVEQVLFQTQEKWEQNGDVDGTVASVLSAADMKKVRELVKSGTLEPIIQKDVNLGHSYNVNQTPTTIFHFKGQVYPYAGVMSYEILRQFLDQLLSQK